MPSAIPTMTLDQEINPWKHKRALRLCSPQAEPDEGLWETAQDSAREIIVHFPVALDSGQIEMFTGFACSTTSPAARPREASVIQAQVTLDEVRALASWMTWKCAGGQYPLRRRQGRRHLRSQSLSQGELERITRRYTSEIIDFIGPEKDVPRPT